MIRAPVRLVTGLTAAVLGILLAGCPPGAQRRPDGSPKWASVEELMAALRANRTEALRVQGTIDMRRADKRVKAHMLYLARRPAWLRFETMSFFDQPLSILVSDGMRFSAWDMQHGRFVTGPATPANISQIIPVPMDGPEVAGILMGDPPWILYAQARIRLEPERGPIELELTNARERQLVWIDPLLLRPVKVRLEREGQLVYSLVFEDWRLSEGRPLVPEKIEFEMPAEQIRLRIRIREADQNPVLPDALFVLEPPAGTPIETW